MSDFAFCVALTAMIFVLLVYLGYPVSAALGTVDRDPLKVRTSCLGLCVLVVLHWHWVTLTGNGVRHFSTVLLLANVVPFVYTARKRWRGRANFLRAIAAPCLLIAASAAVFFRHYDDVFGGSGLRAASLGNNDLPLYAILSQHLVGNGFSAPGDIAGSALGPTVRGDVFGAFALLASLSVNLNVDVQTLVLPVLLLATVVLTGVLTQVVRTATGLPSYLCGGIGLTACASSFYYHSVGHGYIGQLLAMALFGAGVLVLTEHSRGASGRPVVLAAELSVLSAGLLHVYPHMAFLGPPILLAMYAGAQLAASRSALRPQIQVITVVAAGVIVALVLVGSRAVVAWTRTFTLGSIVAGWGLPRVEVTQLLGLQAFTDNRALPAAGPDHDLALSLISWRTVAMVALLATIAVLLVRAVAAAMPEDSLGLGWSFALAAVPTASYYAFYGYFGVGYQQWKWLAFLQPLIVAGTLSLLVILTLRRVGFPAWYRARATVVPVLILASLGLATVSVGATRHTQQVRADLADLPTRLSREAAPGVNLEVATPTAFWDGMWAMYYLQDRVVVPLTTTYFPPQPADRRLPTVRITTSSIEITPPTQP